VLAAAALVAVSGLAKVRRPGPAATAVGMIGIRMPAPAIRLLATGECALGLAAVLDSARLLAFTLALAYAGFAAVTLALRRARAACGCFGDSGAPASGAGAALSACLAAVCGVAAVAGRHDLGWVLGRPAATAATLLLGAAGCVFALVVAYTELPVAWAAWSAR
jgi:hypothetical protein